MKTKTLALLGVFGLAGVAPMAFAHSAAVQGNTVAGRDLQAAVPLTKTEQQLLVAASTQVPGLERETAGSRTQCMVHHGMTYCHTYTLGGEMVADGLMFGVAGWAIGYFAAGPSYPLYWTMWTVGGAATGMLLGANDYYSLPKKA